MTVFLVGAGPGDPGLLTIKGRDALAQADVVLYDDLVDARLLGLTSPGVELISVGKVPERVGAGECRQRRALAQAAINALLVEHGRTGACVVRLKGGDPFVFGRGGEEALALTQAGIPFEVVPGVSATVAAPAYAGIPVTHRGLSSSVAFVTGHEAPEKDAGAARVDWSRLATATDTLVIVMGVGRLPEIAAQLIANGRSPETPAAVVEQGTTPQQRVVLGTLEHLPALARAAQVRSPATIVVGNVAALHAQLAWYARPPEEAAEAHAVAEEALPV